MGKKHLEHQVYQPKLDQVYLEMVELHQLILQLEDPNLKLQFLEHPPTKMLDNLNKIYLEMEMEVELGLEL